MKKILAKKEEEYFLQVSSYKNNNRLCISISDHAVDDFREDIDFLLDVTINVSELTIDKINQVYLSNNIPDEIKNTLFDKGIISRTINTIEYNLDKLQLVEVNLDILREYDEDGVQSFLKLNNENDLFLQYDKDEIRELLDQKVKLVYVDTGLDEFVVRYEDLPDVIVDMNHKLGSVNLKVYDYQNPSMVPILTTFGEFLNKCDKNVRQDIINRLVKLQTGKIEPKKYKIIDEYKLDIVEESMKEPEMER